MTAGESREEVARRELDEQLRGAFRRPNRRSGSIRITVEDTERGREVDVQDERSEPLPDVTPRP